MSIPTSEPPSQPQLPESPRNAKADAKAAKAYAKAIKPWYKKKRVIIPAGLVAFAIAVTAASPKSDTASSAATTSKTSASATGKADHKAGKADDKAGKVGKALTNAGTTYKVTKVNTTETIGDPDLLGARADGTFVVVSLNLTNNKDETKTFMDSSAKLQTADGKSYETSDKAVMAFGDDSLLLKDIQPDLTTRGKLAFDVPPSKLHGSKLVIEDLWGSGEVNVDLGL
jgi:hypothetical protein